MEHVFRLANISGRRFEWHPELCVTYVLFNKGESFFTFTRLAMDRQVAYRRIGRLPIEGYAKSMRGEI